MIDDQVQVIHAVSRLIDGSNLGLEVHLQFGGDDGHDCFVELAGDVGAVVEDELLH